MVLNSMGRDFPGGPVGKTLHSQCRGPGEGTRCQRTYSKGGNCVNNFEGGDEDDES